MGPETGAQLEIFLRALVPGALCGLVWDVCRAVRRTAGGGRAVSAVTDGLFLAAALGLAFGFAVLRAEGRARGYILAAALLGGFGWERLAGRTTDRALAALLHSLVQFRCFCGQNAARFGAGLQKFSPIKGKTKK